MAARDVRRRAITRTGTAICTVALLTLAGCGATKKGSATTGTASTATTVTGPLPGTGRPAVAIGDKNTFPEQFVLGELYEQALAAEGFSVSLDRNIGPTEVTIQALQSGSLSMYPEYMDVWDTAVAGYKRSFSSEHAAYAAGQRYAVDHQLQLLDPTPFSNTNAIGVLLTYAVRHGLSSIGDLRKVAPTLTIGGPPQFENSQTGLAGVEETYGFAPAAFKPLPVGDQYTDLYKGAIQAADMNSTDGQLANDSYALLRDPAHVFGFGNVVPVVTQKVLEQEGPTFMATINAVSALLTLPMMRQLNAAVMFSHEDPAVVAKQFLQAHHLLAPISGS